MSKQKKYTGSNHQGGSRSSPYPVSRLAAQTDLVDIAKEIAQADSMITAKANAKLQHIAKQIKLLQEHAREALEEMREDQALHRAQCHFKRIPGKIYHLYRKNDGVLYFSMLSPSEWRNTPPHEYVDSYYLEADLSWTPSRKLKQDQDHNDIVQQLIQDSE